MKRKALATQFEYKDCRYTHHGGPVARLEKRDKCSFTSQQDVNVRRYNTIVLRRKIRLASYVPAPRLIKHQQPPQFENNPTLA